MKTKWLIWFWSGFPIGMLLIYWLWTNTLWIAVLAGLLGSLHAIYTLLKPQIASRPLFFSSRALPDKYYRTMQRLAAVIFLIICVLAIINYRVTNTREAGIILILFSAVLLCNSIILIFRLSKNESLFYKASIGLGTIVTSIFIVVGIWMIMVDRNFSISKYSIWPFALGYLIGALITIRQAHRHFE